MIGLRIAAAVLGKDLLLDLRSRDRMGHMLVFSALIVVLVSIALPQVRTLEGRAWVPALLWVVFLFTSLLGLGRSFQAETEDGAWAALASVPCDRGWIFVGKAAANFVALVGVQVWTALLASVFLGVSWLPGLIHVIEAALLGAAGLALVGTLLSALATPARFREFLLPVLLFPLVLPVLVLASRITLEATAGRAGASSTSMSALALYDWAFALIGYFVFEYALED